MSIWAEAYDLPHLDDPGKKIAWLPVLDYRFGRHADAFREEGAITLPVAYSRLNEVITVDPDDHTNDVGSVIHMFQREVVDDAGIPKPVGSFVVERRPDGLDSDATSTTQLSGRGLTSYFLDRLRLLPFDSPANPTSQGDWKFGSENLFGNPGLEDGSSSVTTYVLNITATGGTFTITDGTDTTSAIGGPFDDLAATLENELESDLASLIDVVVDRTSISNPTYFIQYVSPPFGPTLTVNTGSLIGGTATLVAEEIGEVSASPWTIAHNFAEPTPPDDAYPFFGVVTTSPRSGTKCLLIDPPSPTAITNRAVGGQQVFNVKPGAIYQAGIWVRPNSSTDIFKFRIVTDGEEILATHQSTLTAGVYNRMELTDVFIPEDVTTIAVRIQITTWEPLNPSAFRVDDAELYEGLPPANIGTAWNMIFDLDTRIDYLVPTFTGTEDSAGDPWDAERSFTMTEGDTLGQIAEAFQRLWGYVHRVRYDREDNIYYFDVFNPGYIAEDHSTTDSGSLIVGMNILSGETVVRSPDATKLRIVGADGSWVEETDTDLETAWGAADFFLKADDVALADDLDDSVQNFLARNRDQMVTFQAAMTNQGQVQPLRDIDIFHNVSVELGAKSLIGRGNRIVTSIVVSGKPGATPNYQVYVNSDAFASTGAAALAEAVRRLLRRSENTPAESIGTPISLGSGAGMMSVTVAAADAPESTKKKADFKCVGVNDADVIQAAVDSLGEAGGTVWLSEGTFNFTWPDGGADCVLTTNPVSIIGMGPQSTLIEISGSLSAVNQSAFALNASGWVKDMSIFDNQSTTVSACVVMGADFSGVENLVVFSEGPSVQMNGGHQTCRNVFFDGGSTDGLAVQGFGPFYISDCTFFVEGICIDLQGAGDVHISGCSAFNGTHFIWLDGLSITISDNESFCDRAIEVAAGSSEIIIDGNLFWGNDGILFTGGFGGGEIIITNNRFEMNDDFAIAVAGTNNLTEFIISGNLFRCDATGSVLVNFDYSGTAGDSIWGMVTDNLFIGADTGLNLGIDSASVTVTGNTFQFLDVGVVGSWSTDVGGGSAISANTFSFCDIGVDFSGGDASQAYTISANAFQNCDVGIRLQDVDGVLISGNSFMWSLFQAILGVSDTDGVHITGNTFDRCGSGANNTYDAILLTATCTNWFIHGNRFRPWATNKTRYGVNVSNANCTGAIIVGNDFGEDSYGTGEINEQSDTQLFYPNDATSIGDNFPGTYTPGGSGVDELAELIDVDLTGLADDDFLRYDSTSGTWLAVDIAPGSGADELADLTDVDLTGLADGDILVYDSGSGEWLPQTPSGGGGYSPLLDVKGSTDDPPDDEFDDSTGMSGATNGLDAKWTAVSGAESAVSLVETGEVERFDLDTRPGWLLLQAGSLADQKVELRQDYTLPDGNSIILALSSPFASSVSNNSITNNELRFGMALNDNDAGYDAGTFLYFAFDVDTNGVRLLVNDGTTTFGSTSDASQAMNAPIGQLMYLRFMRTTTIIRAFWSTDGTAWMPLGNKTMSPTNVWIFIESVVNADEPVPIGAVKWIRLGGNDLDPW